MCLNDGKCVVSLMSLFCPNAGCGKWGRFNGLEGTLALVLKGRKSTFSSGNRVMV